MLADNIALSVDIMMFSAVLSVDNMVLSADTKVLWADGVMLSANIMVLSAETQTMLPADNMLSSDTCYRYNFFLFLHTITVELRLGGLTVEHHVSRPHCRAECQPASL
jgi:hypothetical protein